MEEKEFSGLIYNLVFYYPLGQKVMMAQLYNKFYENVIFEIEVLDENHYWEILTYHNLKK